METQAPENVPDEVTVLLVDDHAIWREGVRSLLQRTEFRVVGEASTASEAVEKTRALHPRLVLLDVRLHDGGDGLDALRAIKRERPETAVVMLTTYDNPGFLLRATGGGAAGYLLKGVSRDELLRSLRAVARGDLLLGAQDLARCLRGIRTEGGGGPADHDPVAPLSAREREVLSLLSTGLSNPEIAAALGVGDSTVKTHVDHILAKLGVSDRVQAAVWAAHRGLVPEQE